MTKLEKLYESIKNLQDLGLPLNKETLQAADNLEELLIKSEILPAMSKNVEPLLSKIQRDLVLVVEYHPGNPISVALSRKAKITEILDAKQLTPQSSGGKKISTPVVKGKAVKPVEPHIPTKKVENSTKGLRVEFPDGTVICRKTAIETFVETLRRIGFERIAALDIMHGKGFKLVSKQQRTPQIGRVWQHECDGWFVYSNISNIQKVQDLELISRHFHLDLKIGEGKSQ